MLLQMRFVKQGRFSRFLFLLQQEDNVPEVDAFDPWPQKLQEWKTRVKYATQRDKKVSISTLHF